MEIILKEDVVNLGYKNDIVTVKSGYGRNYLIPTGKAVIASPSAKKMLAEELKQRAHKLEKIKKDAEAMAEQLKDVTLTIATKVSATGTIFGSVSNIQIAEELEKLGHTVFIFTTTDKDVNRYEDWPVSHGGRGQPTASGSGRCLPDTSSRDSEDAGDGRRAERSSAE